MAWVPWDGCHQISEGCRNCFYYGDYYGSEKKHWKSGMEIAKSDTFYSPVAKLKSGKYKVKSGQTVGTCFVSDFLLEEADQWRTEAWTIIKERYDLNFMFLTKRIDRLKATLPSDWGDGYDNVTIGCTCENQDRANYRLPFFLSVPIKHRFIACTPLLGPIDLTPYLARDERIDSVTVGGEMGKEARICDYDWVLDIREQCKNSNTSFLFKSTGGKFKKGDNVFDIPYKQQHAQARKAGINL